MHASRLATCVLLLVGAIDLAPSGRAAPLDQPLALDVVARLKPEVEQIRKLRFRRQVPVRVVDDAEARKQLIERLDRFDERELLESAARAYSLLGLIPPDYDVWSAVLDVLEEQAGGFYDPHSGSLYLLADMPAAAAPLLAAHELTHALEDQHFDLDARMRRVLDDDDRLFALGAVHEGSATLLMLAYGVRATLAGTLDPEQLAAMSELGAAGPEKLAALPPVLQRGLLGPYVLGARFLARGQLESAMQGFPVDDVNRAYRDAPQSSEQILHPEKYWQQRDDPRRVDLRGAGRRLGRHWKRTSEGVLGELELGVLVGANTPVDAMDITALSAEAWTNDAVAGWDGDRWELWRRGDGEEVVLLLTVWDSVADASEFAAALPRGSGLAWRSAGDAVAIVGGAAGSRVEPLLAHMLAARGGRRRRPGTLVAPERTR